MASALVFKPRTNLPRVIFACHRQCCVRRRPDAGVVCSDALHGRRRLHPAAGVLFQGARTRRRSISHPEMSRSALLRELRSPKKLRRALFFSPRSVARTWLEMPSAVIVVCVTDAGGRASCFGFASCLCFPAEGGPCCRLRCVGRLHRRGGAKPSPAPRKFPSCVCRKLASRRPRPDGGSGSFIARPNAVPCFVRWTAGIRQPPPRRRACYRARARPRPVSTAHQNVNMMK